MGKKENFKNGHILNKEGRLHLFKILHKVASRVLAGTIEKRTEGGKMEIRRGGEGRGSA